MGTYYPELYFPPGARLDEYIAIVNGPGDVKYARVVWYEPIPIYDHFFQLKAAESLYEQELEYVEVGKNEVLQMRLAVVGPAKIKVKLPRATARFTLRRDSGWIDENIAPYPRFPPQTELHLLEDAHLFVDVQNMNGNHAEAAKLYITGWRLVFEEVAEKPKAFSAVIVQGFPPRTR